ncbi:hypothetical protein Acr_00g0070150 [Actinidia rufa]|uniref:Uncharacterized protein n=1 Tax=Actinidia rufa TaxID=165716 RepID=A0A7J0DSY8_9ERIC|nr:hypothetical protein Acr_00g0070150 [Actinidia rufa]
MGPDQHRHLLHRCRNFVPVRLCRGGGGSSDLDLQVRERAAIARFGRVGLCSDPVQGLGEPRQGLCSRVRRIFAEQGRGLGSWRVRDW